MKKPEISVLLSTYNDEKYILSSIFSLLAQTFVNIEIIVVNDGSNDDTSMIVKSINDPRVILIEHDNVGLTKSLNIALGKARGKWIARQDSDDMSMYNRFEIQLRYLNQNPNIHLLGSSLYKTNTKYNFVNEALIYPKYHDEIVEAIQFLNPFVHGSVIVLREIIEKCNGYNEEYKYVQDYELWCRIIKNVCAANIEIPLYMRRVHLGSSEVCIDKRLIFEKIRNDFFATNTSINGDIVNLYIKSVNIRPGMVNAHKYNKHILSHYCNMAKVAKIYNQSNLKYYYYGLMQNPWYI